MNNNTENTLWVEKYRPDTLEGMLVMNISYRK